MSHGAVPTTVLFDFSGGDFAKMVAACADDVLLPVLTGSLPPRGVGSRGRSRVGPLGQGAGRPGLCHDRAGAEPRQCCQIPSPVF